MGGLVCHTGSWGLRQAWSLPSPPPGQPENRYKNTGKESSIRGALPSTPPSEQLSCLSSPQTCITADSSVSAPSPPKHHSQNATLHLEDISVPLRPGDGICAPQMSSRSPPRSDRPSALSLPPFSSYPRAAFGQGDASRAASRSFALSLCSSFSLPE